MKRAVIFSVLIVTANVVFAQSDQQPLANVKISKTPEVIKVLDVRKKGEPYEKQAGRKLTPDERRQVLNSLIDEKLVIQAAKQSGINVTDADVSKYFLATIAQQVGREVTEPQFAEIVKQQTGKTLDQYFVEQLGMNVAEYKNDLKNRLTAQEYIAQQKKADIEKVAATDKEVRDFYENNKSKFSRNDLLKIFLVVSLKGTDPTASKKRVTDIMNEVKGNPKKCEDVIKRLQSDAQMRAVDFFIERRPENAQRLGLTQEKLAELFTQKVNFVSEVVETDNDFQFFMVREKYEAKMLKIDDEIQPGSGIKVYDYIKTNITAQKKQQYFTGPATQEVIAELRSKPDTFALAKKEDEIKKLLSW